jgi:hypothetical protein
MCLRPTSTESELIMGKIPLMLSLLVLFAIRGEKLSAQAQDTTSPSANDTRPTLVDSLSELRAELASTRRDLLVVRERHQQRQAEIAALQRSLQDAEERLTGLTQDVATTMDSLSAKKVSLAQALFTIDTMRVGLSRFLDEIRRRSDNERALMELVGQKESALAASRGELETIAKDRARQTETLERQQDSILSANALIRQSQAEIADLEAQQSSLDQELKQLAAENRQREGERRRLQAKLDGPARIALWVGFGFALLIGSVMLYLGLALITCAFRNNAFKQNSGALEETSMNPVSHIEGQLSYYGAMAHIFRQVISLQVIASGMLLVAIVAFVFVYGQDPVKLIGEDGFWKTIAAIGVPLAFVTGAYNVIEGRRLELVKLSFELRKQTVATAPLAVSPYDESKAGSTVTTRTV